LIPRQGSEHVKIPDGLTVLRARNIHEAISVALADA
jgi:hypothetical protein